MAALKRNHNSGARRCTCDKCGATQHAIPGHKHRRCAGRENAIPLDKRKRIPGNQRGEWR